MNRAQRRAIGVNKSQEDEVQRMIDYHAKAIVLREREQIEDLAIQKAYLTLNAMYALVLNSEHGFGKKRINRIIEKVKQQFLCIRGKYVSANDVSEWCKEKGIQFNNIFADEEDK